MPVCPFQNRECYPECALYADGIQNCCLVAQTMLLQDIQRIAVIAYEKFLSEEGKTEETEE